MYIHDYTLIRETLYCSGQTTGTWCTLNGLNSPRRRKIFWMSSRPHDLISDHRDAFKHRSLQMMTCGTINPNDLWPHTFWLRGKMPREILLFLFFIIIDDIQLYFSDFIKILWNSSGSRIFLSYVSFRLIVRDKCQVPRGGPIEKNEICNDWIVNREE